MRQSTVWAICAVSTSVLLSAGEVGAASFDCAKAASRIEHMVCDDVSLSMLDGQLDAAYVGALDRSIHPEQVTAKQRAWLRQREGCPDQKCMLSAYTEQIALLSAISDEPAVCSGSTTLAVNACAKEYGRRADNELSRYIAAARKRIVGETAEDGGQGTTKDTLATFDASQAAWVDYRKSECEAVYDSWSGGTIRGDMYEGCWQSVTKSRTTEVWGNWLTFMDSTPALMPKPTNK